MKHTKGPWTPDYEGGYIFADNGQMMVAQVRGWGRLQYKGVEVAIKIQEANARLIAAAPDMLKALNRLLGPGGDLHNGDAQELGLAAITKATP